MPPDSMPLGDTMASSPTKLEVAVDQLLNVGREVAPPASLAANARMRDYAAEYARSIDANEKFWQGVACELDWFEPWNKIFEWTYPTIRWFAGRVSRRFLPRTGKDARRVGGDGR